ncbi:MAG: MBL fold metallo-hydrolase [Bacteroidales bacterium]|nr:MBL fold metallo-hydrolase [Bacteroidales bacterium]
MKKPVRRVLWGFSIFISFLLIAALIFFIKFMRATKSMTPVETSAINDTVWAVKDKFVNAFIFKGDSGYVMIDAGFSKRNFARELKKTGISPQEIKTVLLTHTDGDHIAAISLLENPVIYMHRDEEQMINGTNGKTKYNHPVWKYGPYKLLDSNDTLMIYGLKIKILPTPGHTPGSCCYVIGNDYLLTGDNLVIKDGRYEHFLEMFNMDTPLQIKSLTQLPDPGQFKYILTAHNGVVKMEE